METLAFIKRWLPKQVSQQAKGFRNKLGDEPEDEVQGLELAALSLEQLSGLVSRATPVAAYELHQIARSNSGTSSRSDHAVQVETAVWSAGSRASSSETRASPGLDVELSTSCSTPNAAAGGSQASKATDTLQQWWGASAPVRLVLGVLLERLDSCTCQQQLDQVLVSSSWDDACQYCRDALLLW